jgi:hypothetical protein
MNDEQKPLSRIEIIAGLMIEEAKERRSKKIHQNFAAAIQAIGFEVDKLVFPVVVEANSKGE